jgi:hypothetical protein
MKNQLVSFRWSKLALFSALITSSLAANAATFQKDEDQFINIGVASRISYSSISDAAPNGKDRSNDFTVEEARIYTNGKVHKNVGFEFNLARNSSDNQVEILDAHLGLELNNYFNVWIGRFLPPASRASASAPAYPPSFDFPIAEQAPNQFGGRDDGASIWGGTENQALKYQVGAFKGRRGTSNQADNLSYAAKVQYNFWDAEPGFYNLASYDGSKSILSVGSSIRYQKDGAGTLANPGDYRYWNIDGRLEKPLEDGAVVGAEASYYDYDNDDTNDLTAPQGKGYFILGSYTFPQVIGIGKIQPKFVYQKFDNNSSGVDTKRYDLGASYLINGSSNTRIDVFGFKQTADNTRDVDGFKVLFHVAHFF